MQVFLIEENQRNFIKKFFNVINVENDKIIINGYYKEMKLKKKIKIVKKIKEILVNNDVNTIIVSNNLKQDSEIINLFYSNGLNIINGKILFKMLVNKYIYLLCKNNNILMQENKIAITVNFPNSFTINCIQKLAKEFKMVNVVTSNIDRFKNLKEKMWNDYGIIITLTNNRKKALASADIILNVDFPEEIINQYQVFEKSIIINLDENIKIKKKRFEGKIINDYEIYIKPETEIYDVINEEKYKNFDIKDLCEIYVLNNKKEIENINVKI